MSDLVTEIENVVLATPGVLALYRAGSLVTNLIGAAVESLGVSEDAATRVIVRRTVDATEVDVAIGIEPTAGSVEVAETVRERVRRLLEAEPGLFVRITVVHVADGRSPASR